MKTFLLPLFGITFLFILFASCKEEVETKPTIDGVYESVGYGRIVKIENGEYLLADVTSLSCLPLMEGKIAEFGDNLQLKNDTLSLIDGINIYYFTRIDDAPAICKKDTPEYNAAQAKANDPENNFEVLWETFTEHYAYFDLRKVDPEKMYAEYRPQVTSETTEAELFFIMQEMLDSFNDGHISISASEEIEEAAQQLRKIKTSKEITAKPANSAKPNERLRKNKISKLVADHYIPNGKTVKNGNLRWGLLKNNVGYLQLNQMMALVNLNLSDTLSYNDYWRAYFKIDEERDITTQEEVDGLNESLDIIMGEFANTSALIIDVRFNGGGKDEAGMALLARLIDTEKLVFTKKGTLGNGFTPIIEVKQAGSKQPYSNPVFLLIGPESASATEIMALSSLSLPNITRIGSRTEGVFSDILDKTLPNGWEFGLSSEVYLDLKGNNYEGVGVPPDVEIGYPRDTQEFLRKVVDDLEKEGDASIEKALVLSKSN